MTQAFFEFTPPPKPARVSIPVNVSVEKADEVRLSKQCAALIDRLLLGSATNVELMVDLRILNLTARVSECRDAGYDIPPPVREGGGVFRYRLVTR